MRKDYLPQTLNEFITFQQTAFPYAKGDLSRLLSQIDLDFLKVAALSSRYIGSLVSDFHRNLMKGGIYMYALTESQPGGKLRLLYECNPIAFLIEQAGGKATDGHGKRIMEIVPKAIHQRVPFSRDQKK